MSKHFTALFDIFESIFYIYIMQKLKKKNVDKVFSYPEIGISANLAFQMFKGIKKFLCLHIPGLNPYSDN